MRVSTSRAQRANGATGFARRLSFNVRQGPGSMSGMRDKLLCGVLLGFLLTGCSTSSEVFRERAYEQTVSLKVDALALMDRSTLPFEWAKPDVEAIKLRFVKAYEYANGLPELENSARGLGMMMDAGANSFFGFLARWEAEGKLTKELVQEGKLSVSRDFDRVIAVESGTRTKLKDARSNAE